jgi:hypothetical protein
VCQIFQVSFCNVTHPVTNCILEFLYVMCSNIFSVFLEFICYAYSTRATALSVADLQKTIKENHVSVFLCHHVAEAGPSKTLSPALFWVKSPGYKPSQGVAKVKKKKESKSRISETIFITP